MGEKKMMQIDFFKPQRFLFSLAMLFSFSFLAPLSANADEQPDWKKVEAEVGTLMESNDCAGVWKTLWPLAKTNHPEALTLLTQIVTLRYLVPPQSISALETATPEEQRLDHLLALALYDWKGLTPDAGFTATDVVAGMQAERGGENYQRLSTCMKENEDKDQCVKLAADMKLIPAFDDYVKIMDQAKNTAICLPDNRPKN